MTRHEVLLSKEEKESWFVRHLEERHRINPLRTEQDLVKFLRSLRVAFKIIYGRDVPGYFIRNMAAKCGIEVKISDRTQEKIDYAFNLMDTNAHFRTSKRDLATAMKEHFRESTLHYIIDDIFDDWHDRTTKGDPPEPEINIDLHGQEPLFEE